MARTFEPVRKIAPRRRAEGVEVTYLSVCSGIEAASVAWHPLGWQAVAFSEIEPFPCAVLARHFPDVPNLGDMTRFKEWPDYAIDLLVGGTPCQSFSVAGLRRGLDDPRGNLMLVYLAIARRYAPRWVVWENVPGVLSSHGGRDFGTFLGALAECGYGFAYRVLDAQFFGVPQRRRRVFVVGYLGDWRPPAAVLFERESLRGDPPPSRETGERVADSLTRGAESSGKGGYAGRRREDDSNLVAAPLVASGRGTERAGDSRGQDTLVSYAVNAHGGSGRMDGESETFIAFAQNQREEVRELARAGAVSGIRRGDAKNETLIAQPTASSIKTRGGNHAGQDADALDNLIAHALRGDGFDASEDGTGRGTPLVSGTLRGHTRPGSNSLSGMTGVRRLTVRECERLMGFPDDYTAIPYHGKSAADGPRYKALGNSMAVPVMSWIGERIQKVEEAVTT